MMTIEEIMDIALDLAAFPSIPADSEIHRSAGATRVLVSIDVGTAELLLARQLGFDCVIAHHPAGGRARVEGYKVFERHYRQLVDFGVSEEKARKVTNDRISRLSLAAYAANYDPVVAAANELGIGLVSIHSPCDEVGRRIMTDAVRRRLESRHDPVVKEVIEGLMGIPEFAVAKSRIEVLLGSPENAAGKVVVSHAAFTDGGYDIAKVYFEEGANTLLYIHIAEQDLAKLRSEFPNRNLIVTGHIASDWIGLNRLIAVLRDKGLEVKTLSEFDRRSN